MPSNNRTTSQWLAAGTHIVDALPISGTLHMVGTVTSLGTDATKSVGAHLSYQTHVRRRAGLPRIHADLLLGIADFAGRAVLTLSAWCRIGALAAWNVAGAASRALNVVHALNTATSRAEFGIRARKQKMSSEL